MLLARTPEGDLLTVAIADDLQRRAARDVDPDVRLNLTRIDRTPQIFFARRTAHVVSYEEAWGDE